MTHLGKLFADLGLALGWEWELNLPKLSFRSPLIFYPHLIWIKCWKDSGVVYITRHAFSLAFLPKLLQPKGHPVLFKNKKSQLKKNPVIFDKHDTFKALGENQVSQEKFPHTVKVPNLNYFFYIQCDFSCHQTQFGCNLSQRKPGGYWKRVCFVIPCESHVTVKLIHSDRKWQRRTLVQQGEQNKLSDRTDSWVKLTSSTKVTSVFFSSGMIPCELRIS